MNDQRRDLARFQKAVTQADWPKALRWIDRLVAANSDTASLHYNRGLVLKNLHRRRDALAAFEMALRFDPEHANARFEQGAALFDLGRFDDAADKLRSYLERVPDDADAELNLGLALLRLGRPDEARASLLKAHDLAGNSDTTLALATAERDRGNLAAMDKLIKTLDHGDPTLAAAVLKLRTQGSQGRLPLKADRS